MMNRGLGNQSGNNVVRAVRVIVNNNRRLTFDEIVVLLPPEMETFCTQTFSVHSDGQRFVSDDQIKSAMNDWLKK